MIVPPRRFALLLVATLVFASRSALASPPILSGVMTQPLSFTQTPCLAVADLNEDGVPDLLVGASDIVWFSVRSDGAPRAGATFLPARVNALATADFDRDGHSDVVGSVYSGGSLIVGFGAGTGQVSRTLTIPLSVGAWGVIATDVNSDSFMDILAALPGDRAIAVALGNGDGTFRPVTESFGGTQPIYLAAGDFNRDGILDVADSRQRQVSASGWG